MADLKLLRVTRGTIKSQLTTFEKFINSRNADDMEEITSRLSKLQEQWSKFGEVQLQIEIHSQTGEEIDEAIAEQNATERQEFEERYFEAEKRAKKRLKELRGDQHQEDRVLPEQAVTTNPVTSNRMNVKLPVLTLPTFKGDYDEWLLFKDSFDSIINKNPDLTAIQKFQYLRSSLTGEALQIINALKVSAENYRIGWQLLVDRYEDKRRIITTHIRKLLEFPATPKEDHAAMRNFFNHINTNLRELESLEHPVKAWDAILISLATNKLDYKTRQDWENKVAEKESREMPTLEELLKFLNKRSSTIEAMKGGTASQEQNKSTIAKNRERRVTLAATKPWSCKYCSGQHSLYQCEEFSKLPVKSRWDKAKENNWCLNCLGKGHYTKDCKSSMCKECAKPHNTLLHLRPEDLASMKNSKEKQKIEEAADKKPTEEKGKERDSVVAYVVERKTSQVMLATAQILIKDASGVLQKFRALLDPGSQSNLITTEAVRKLGLPTRKENQPISGINQMQTSIHQSTRVEMRSMYGNFTAPLECLVLPRITETLPQVKVDPKRIMIPKDIRLADPTFNIPGTIDLLIGAALFWNLLCSERVKKEKNQPILQKTKLGWIIGGEIVDTQAPSIPTSCNLLPTQILQEQIERFWRQEEAEAVVNTKDELACEEFFKDTFKRDEEGRFIVPLPKVPEVPLGDSKDQAQRRLYTLERRLSKQPEIKEQYVKFLEEYERAGHMSLLKSDEDNKPGKTYYIPHQPVVRPDSLSTKLRVVFDASARTTTGYSLNDKLAAGPNLQNDLVDIILRFRTHEYVITADIEKMFRQVIIEEQDRDLQRILWRRETTEEVKIFQLNTVTYGTTCAPFLAMRCLRQLAIEGRSEFPLAARALERDFYMDDVLTGSSNIQETTTLRRELTKLLATARFNLRQWRTNAPKVLEHVEDDYKTRDLLTIDKQEAMKTLGLLWDANTDTIQYKVSALSQEKVTRRDVLSQIAQVYDPLGLIGPIIMRAKILMQQLWQENLEWDQLLPQSLQQAWTSYRISLARINEIKLPRNVNPDNLTQEIELFGFGDASEKAYGACLYAVSADSQGTLTSRLICSKSKVAPLKTISLPRLELNAALLLSQLVERARNSFGEKVTDTYLWSDSTIVLEWIKTQPCQLKTFVANRITQIQELTKNANWNHVASNENPADLLSRGTTTDKLLKEDLWWNGPEWITSNNWPEQPASISTEIPEMKIIKPTTVLVATNVLSDAFTRISSYKKLRRIIAYCHKFINGLKKRKQNKTLTVQELEEADTSIARAVQQEAFAQEIKDMKAQHDIDKKSKLKNLNPYLDEKGLIRVGGRLRLAELPMEQQHPIILPIKHHVTRIIMRDEHIRLLHCGPEQLLCSVRQKYWPLSGRKEARKITHSCTKCFRYKPQPAEAMMADLPKARVTGFVRPFATSGVDYAGPIQTRESRRRGRVYIMKSYIAVFTCFSTKAVHLELVSDLTTEAFIAALKRFVARRGLCTQLYSDNGTNFVGAERELREIYEFLSQKGTEIASVLANQKVNWNFIPPRAPHHGGLWEAAVKATKRLLKIVTNNQILTFEECYTLLTQIEAVLNSRPLTPLSSDPNDLRALTPTSLLGTHN